MPSAVRSSPSARAFGLMMSWLAGCTSPGAPERHAAAPHEAAPGPGARAGAPLPPSALESLEQLRQRLLDEQDTDCDQRITRVDQGTPRFRFELQGQPHEVSGSYALSNLLQELSLGLGSGVPPRFDRVTEDPVERTARLIRTRYWDALTRRIDEDGVPRVLEDPKLSQQGDRRLYVPPDDPRAFEYFQGVAKRHDAAYARLGRGVAGLAMSDLIQASASPEQRRVLMAMLRSTEGRLALADVARRLASITQTLEYPALSQHLMLALGRINDLTVQASRACVQSSAARLGRVAARMARELESFGARKLSVQKLPPPDEWREWTASLGDHHGPLSLALEQGSGSKLTGVPFVVPGGRFNEMYGWDSYFILLGLLSDERLDLARGLVDNFVYSIEHYKAILNANRTYYLTRSQPPFLSSMIRAVWEATPRGERSIRWLARAVDAALYEYANVWAASPRQVSSLCRGEGDQKACLSSYAGIGTAVPPEVEAGHFDWLWQHMGGSLESSYRAGRLSRRDLTAELDSAFKHDRCMRESGHDTTYRWFWKSTDASGQESFVNRCADMVTVDLNSLLYKYEVDIAHLLRQLLTSQATGESLNTTASLAGAAEPSSWCRRAQHRFELMKRHLWSARDGLFYDAFLSPSGPVLTGYVSATTLYPLWATALPCELNGDVRPQRLSAEEKSALVTSALGQLEAPGGLLATARASRDRFATKPDRQWEYPNGWAPHQILAWQGLEAHGFHEDAERLSFAWLFTLLTNAIDFNGTIPEKYDVVARTHAVFSEYGNVGTEFDYIASEGFGWMNASFQLAFRVLSPKERHRLSQSVAKR